MVSRGLMMVFMIVVVSLLWISTKSAGGNATNCISDYNEFKNLTFNHGSYGAENRQKLFNSFYKPNHHLPFSVYVFYQTVLPNKTIQNITIGKCNSHTAWAWMSSPVFLVARAEYLNKLSLYMLNNFHPLGTYYITIRVPQPCQKQIKELLSLLTSQVSQNDVCMWSTHAD